MTDMLKLLKIIDKVEKPVMINEAVSLNISANGDCPEDITSILGKLVNLSNPTPVTDKMMPQGDNHDVMMKTISDVGNYADQAGNDVDEEYSNEPNPVTLPVSAVTVKAGGGMNGPKKQYKKEYPGDNPMAVAEDRANALMLEYRKMLEATDPRDSRPQTYRKNNTGYAWDRLSTRMTSDPKDSKARKAGKQSGLKHSIKDALGKHGPKGHLPEATDKKPTDDAKKKKSEKMKAYRADRDKHGED